MSATELDALDRAAAEKIMGWTVHDEADWAHWKENDTVKCFVHEWQPTRDIGQAFELLEKMDFTYAIARWWKTPDCLVIGAKVFRELGVDVQWSEADTASLAITRACLKARGIEVP